MELDSRKKSRRNRMMRSKSLETQEVREITRKEAGESRGFPKSQEATLSGPVAVESERLEAAT